MKVINKNRNLITTFTKGDIFSRLSYIVMGLANIRNGQVIKGLIFLMIEVAYFMFMLLTGRHNLHMKDSGREYSGYGLQ